MNSQSPNQSQSSTLTSTSPSKRRVVLGIDNGVTGAIAVLDFETHEALDLIDLPSREGCAGEREIDPFRLGEIIKELQAEYVIIRAVVERVDPQGKPLSKRAFMSMGCSKGVVMCVLELSLIAVVWVTASVWRPKMVGKGDKKKSLDVSRQRFPNMRPKLVRVSDHNRAEALMIGAFGLA